MRQAAEQKHIIIQPGPSPAEKNKGSAMCVPIVRAEKYLGCVYLANRIVAGLFSDNASKAAQIIAAQAGFLIENVRLMEEYKSLNAQLESKVKEQTRDIAEKNEQLHAVNTQAHRIGAHEGPAYRRNRRTISRISRPAFRDSVKLLSYRYGDDTKTIRNIDLAIESCTDIINLASNLLDISKMEEGKLALQHEADVLRGMAAIAQKYGSNVLFDERKIKVAIDPPEGNDFAVLATRISSSA